MIKRKVYKVKKSGMIAVMIPGKMVQEAGISDITHVCIREMGAGMWKVWAPEVSDKGVSVVENTETEATE